MLRPKYVVFALIALMMGYVLVHNERFLIEPDSPMWPHFSNYGWWIVTHAVAGVAALFLAPFQFSDRLRQRYTNAASRRRLRLRRRHPLPGAARRLRSVHRRVHRRRAPIVHGAGHRGRGDAVHHHGRRPGLCPAAPADAAPPVDDPQLRRGAGVLRRPADPRRDRPGDRQRGDRAGGDLDAAWRCRCRWPT